MALTGSQKVAVLLSKFTDTATAEQHPKSFYEDLFVKRDTGGLNDYWRAASLGNIDLDGSKVFGWKTIGMKKQQFLDANPSRLDKIQAALAAHSTVDGTKFQVTVAIFNTDLGDAGTWGGVLAGPGDVNGTFLAHEIGHNLGFDHSWDQSDRKTDTWSGPGEYWDQHDLMSAMNCFGDIGHAFSPRGPLLNVGHLDRVGWMPPSRLFQLGNNGNSGAETIDLVALEHPEVGGYLAAKVGDVYVEFRIPSGWDSGLPRPCILFHEINGSNTLVLASDHTTLDNEWQPGMFWGTPPTEMLLIGGCRVDILSFNLKAKTARIRLRRVAARFRGVGPGIIVGGVKVGGNGAVILPGGQIIPIPPNSPLLRLVEALDLLRTDSKPTLGTTGAIQIDPKVIGQFGV